MFGIAPTLENLWRRYKAVGKKREKGIKISKGEESKYNSQRRERERAAAAAQQKHQRRASPGHLYKNMQV